MTMLDRMRRHKNWLKWSLFLVVVAFIALYFPDFIGAGGPPRSTRRSRAWATSGSPQARSAARTSARCRPTPRHMGAASTSRCSSSWAWTSQILRQLIDERAAVAEAKRLGLTVSDAEVAQRIFAIPAFQQNGVFGGEQLYAQILASQNPPLTKAEFEDNLRQSLLVDKLRAALTDWVAVTDAELEAEFTRRNEKVKAEIVVFSADRLRDQVSVTDADVAVVLRVAQGGLPRRRAAQDQVRARRRRAAARARGRAPRRSREVLPRQRAAVHDGRTGARQPHPPQDRGQGRSRGEGQGRGAARSK